jgi:glycogen synthase
MFDDQAGWGASDTFSSGDVVKDAMKKEQIIKCVGFHLVLALTYSKQRYYRPSRRSKRYLRISNLAKSDIYFTSYNFQCC